MAREFYRDCQAEAKLSYDNRSKRAEKLYIGTVVLSIDFAQATEVD